jgi:hypothetical protein
MNQFTSCIWKDASNEAFLTRRWAEGASAEFIAREMGTTKGSIIGKVFRLRLAKRETSDKLRLRRSGNPKGRPKGPPKSPVKARVQRTPLPIPTTGLLRFVEPRNSFQCVFPMWPDNQAWKPSEVHSVMLCGRAVEKDKPYCAAHCSLAYVPEKKRERGGFVLFPRTA